MILGHNGKGSSELMWPNSVIFQLDENDLTRELAYNSTDFKSTLIFYLVLMANRDDEEQYKDSWGFIYLFIEYE
jgi:hypothetical protein